MYIEFRMFRKKEKKKGGLEVQKRPGEATACLRVWVATEKISIATELSDSVLRHSSLFRNMVHRLQRVVGSRHSYFSSGFLSREGSSLCRDSVLFFIVTMSRQRVPCRD